MPYAIHPETGKLQFYKRGVQHIDITPKIDLGYAEINNIRSASSPLPTRNNTPYMVIDGLKNSNSIDEKQGSYITEDEDLVVRKAIRPEGEWFSQYQNDYRHYDLYSNGGITGDLDGINLDFTITTAITVDEPQVWYMDGYSVWHKIKNFTITDLALHIDAWPETPYNLYVLELYITGDDMFSGIGDTAFKIVNGDNHYRVFNRYPKEVYKVYGNGVELTESTDYTISGRIITLIGDDHISDAIIADYKSIRSTTKYDKNDNCLMNNALAGIKIVNPTYLEFPLNESVLPFFNAYEQVQIYMAFKTTGDNMIICDGMELDESYGLKLGIGTAGVGSEGKLCLKTDAMADWWVGSVVLNDGVPRWFYIDKTSYYPMRVTYSNTETVDAVGDAYVKGTNSTIPCKLFAKSNNTLPFIGEVYSMFLTTYNYLNLGDAKGNSLLLLIDGNLREGTLKLCSDDSNATEDADFVWIDSSYIDIVQRYNEPYYKFTLPEIDMSRNGLVTYARFAPSGEATLTITIQNSFDGGSNWETPIIYDSYPDTYVSFLLGVFTQGQDISNLRQRVGIKGNECFYGYDEEIVIDTDEAYGIWKTAIDYLLNGVFATGEATGDAVYSVSFDEGATWKELTKNLYNNVALFTQGTSIWLKVATSGNNAWITSFAGGWYAPINNNIPALEIDDWVVTVDPDGSLITTEI